MADIYNYTGVNALAVEECDPEGAHKYRIVAKVPPSAMVSRSRNGLEVRHGHSAFKPRHQWLFRSEREILKILETQERCAGIQILLTDGMVAHVKSQEFAANHFKAENYNCGALDGLILAHLASALQRPGLARQ